MSEYCFEKILLLVEGADMDHVVLASAIARAKTNHAKLVALNVVDHMVINRMKRVSEQNTAEIEIELEEKGWKALYYAEEFAKDQGVPIVILQSSGVVENVILSEATRLKIDLIILGYPRKMPGQAKRLAMGRVEKVVENAECSVLIVR